MLQRLQQCVPLSFCRGEAQSMFWLSSVIVSVQLWLRTGDHAVEESVLLRGGMLPWRRGALSSRRNSEVFRLDTSLRRCYGQIPAGKEEEPAETTALYRPGTVWRSSRPTWRIFSGEDRLRVSVIAHESTTKQDKKDSLKELKPLRIDHIRYKSTCNI